MAWHKLSDLDGETRKRIKDERNPVIVRSGKQSWMQEGWLIDSWTTTGKIRWHNGSAAWEPEDYMPVSEHQLADIYVNLGE